MHIRKVNPRPHPHRYRLLATASSYHILHCFNKPSLLGLLLLSIVSENIADGLLSSRLTALGGPREVGNRDLWLHLG